MNSELPETALKKCIVAYVDILGSPSILCSADRKDVSKFIYNMHGLYDKLKDRFSPFYIKTFSDNILIYYNNKGEEKTFMYGVNVKPYKKGAENSPAWDICTVHRSFNAIGPTHSKPRPMILPGDWGNAGRIFDSEEITYPKIDDIHRDSFIEWMYNSYGVDVSPDFKKNKGLYTYLKRYNFEKANGTLMKISSAIMKSDRDYLSAIGDRMPEEMKNKKIIDSR